MKANLKLHLLVLHFQLAPRQLQKERYLLDPVSQFVPLLIVTFPVSLIPTLVH